MDGLDGTAGRSERRRAFGVRRFVAVVLNLVCAAGAALAGDASPETATMRSLLAEGSRAYERGDVDAAIHHWKQAVDQAQREAAAGERIDGLMNLARAYQALGQYRRAAAELATALAIAEQSGDEVRGLALKNVLGAVLTAMRRWSRAEALLAEAEVVAKEGGNDAARAGILNNLGNLYAAQGEYQKAEELYKEGFGLAQRAGLTAEAARLMANAGISAGAAGRYAEALAHNGKATQLLPKVEDRREKAYLLITAGQTDERLLHHVPESRDQLLRRALASYRAALEAAKRTGDRRAQSYAYGYLGRLYELEERADEALQLTRQATFLAQELRAPELLYRWQWQTGRLLGAKGELEAAIHSLQQAVSTFESIRHELAGGVGNLSLLTNFREAVGAMYYELADALLQLADRLTEPDRAVKCVLDARQAIEQFKSAELVDYFRDRCIDLARTDVRQIEAVARGTGVVYLIPLGDRTEVILSHASGLKRVKVAATAEQLTAEAREFRRRLEDRTSHRYRTSGQRLYGWLIKPLEEALAAEGITTLVFVPDGALRTIPMAALHDGKSFLVERYAVAVAPGLTLVAPRPFAADWKALLMCGISEPVAGFSPLVHVEAELDQLEALCGGRRLMDETFLLSELEKQFAARPPRVLHIASHGQFSADPTKTFVLTHDTKLTLDDLEMLIRPSEFRGRPLELLSLSACETAAGDDRAALGLAGVALKAGARSAMATLWLVNDEVSARLVSRFYEELYKHPGRSKAEALQAAQAAIMTDQRYRHPCYWAPYLIIGNWL